MAVDSGGTLQVRGESGPGVPVRVQVDGGRLKVVSGEETLGDWAVSEIGIRDLSEGFSVRAEGEEIILIVDDEVGFADEVGLASATPRLARKVATAHNPEARELVEPEPDDSETRTNVLAITFALGGVMVLLGGTFLRSSPSTALADGGSTADVAGFWGAFVAAGVLMVAIAFTLTLRKQWARVAALLLMAGIVIVFGFMITDGDFTGAHVPAYGFIAGGIVVGVAVLFSDSLRSNPE